MADNLPGSDYGIYSEIGRLIDALGPDKALVERLIFDLLGKLDLTDRTTLAFEIYTADYTESMTERQKESEELIALMQKHGITPPEDEEEETQALPVKGAGSQALRFRDLGIGDVFVCVPGPRDKHGNGGFRHTLNIYRKTKDCKFSNRLDSDEFWNVSRVTDGREFTIHPNSWVLKVAYDKTPA